MLKTKRPQRNGLRILTAAAAVFLLLLLAVVPVSAGDAVRYVASGDELTNALTDADCKKIIVIDDIIHSQITSISHEVTVTTDGNDRTITSGITVWWDKWEYAITQRYGA